MGRRQQQKNKPMHPANIDLQRPRPFSSHAAEDDGNKPAMILSAGNQQDQMYEDNQALVQQPLQAQGADAQLYGGNAQKKKRGPSEVDYNFLLKQQNDYNDDNNITNDIAPPQQQQQQQPLTGNQFGGNQQGFVYNGGMAGGFNQNYGQNQNFGQNQNYGQNQWGNQYTNNQNQMPPEPQFKF